MGQDKAGLLIDGQPLWQRQVGVLRAIHPAELFISGRADGPYQGAGIPIIQDTEPDLGPLGGLAAAFHHATTDWLLVLAIDLPKMTADFLTGLVREVSPGIGLVPVLGERFEPLAALYPRACLPLIEEGLQNPDRSLQRVVRSAVDHGWLRPRPVRENEADLFRNVNRPEDLAALGHELRG